MNVNKLLIEAGEAIGYPVAQDIYEEESDRYIVFTYEDERDVLAADNEGQEETAWLMVSMNTPKDYDYFQDKKNLKKELKARGFNVENVQSWLEGDKAGTKKVRRTIFTVNITSTVEE